MEFAAPVVDQVVESLLTRITKELGYWFSSRKNVQAMNDEMARLNAAEKEIEKQKEEYDVRAIQLPPQVATWLEDFKKIKKEAERIPSDGIGIGCFNIKRRYKAGKQSSDILENIKSRVGNIPQFEGTGEKILARVPTKNHASSSGTDKNHASSSGTVDDGAQNSFETRHVIFEKALKCLEPKNSKTQMIALCGMGGVGKSHMMDRLETHVKYNNIFNYVVKVVVGQSTGLIALQQAVAEKTGGGLTETTSDARAERLENRFAAMSKDGEKKILVILDDLWEEVNLKDIGLTSPLPNGFKLLITSRYFAVCAHIGVEIDSIFRIGALNDIEAKILFFETVGASKDNDPDLYKIGEDIIQRCGNLPIALKTIASTLKGHIKDEFEWQEALSRLQHHDLKDHYGTVHQVFKISYDFLKMKDEQAIFLLSGLFPDDFDIPVEELMWYAWGLKLLSKVNTLAKARRQVKVCVNKLIGANLLAESDRVGCVNMHDLARAFALSNSTELKQASIVYSQDISEQLTQDPKESYQRLLLKCTGVSEFPKDFDYPNLAFLKLMDGGERLKFSEDFCENMEKLKVLSYEEMLSLPLLPRSLQCSTSLRTLCFNGCRLISDCSFVSDLVSLEILSFANCRIKTLPSAIGKLKKLKLLDLTGCLDLRIEDGVLRKLEKLEELYMRVSGQKAISFTDANCDELEKLSMQLSALDIEFFNNKAQPKNMSFKNLERFGISIGCLLKNDNDIYFFQNTLNLVTNSNDLVDCNINELFNKTEKLYLKVKDMKHLKDVSMHPPQDSFSKLKVLEVVNCQELRYLFTVAMANGLRRLERLTVYNCEVLELLIRGDESENGGAGVIKFTELKFLSLQFLPKLGSLCDIDKVVELPQLVELELFDLPNFTSIYPDSALQPLLNKQVIIPKLEKLKISFLDNLKQIWPSEITSGEEVQISTVRVVDVRRCKSLVNLFPCNPMPLLRNLEKLLVAYCPSIEVLFNIDLGRARKIEEVSSSLRSIRVTSSMNLTEVWRIKGVNNSQVSGFQDVENIQIRGCRRFRNVFTPVTTNFDMKAFLDIDIQDSGDSLFNKALQSLQPINKATKIALCGLGSVGKTRMMNQLVEEFHSTGMFCLVVTLVIGREANPIALQQATAEYLNEPLSEIDKEARADRLYKGFMQISQDGKNRILLILDDLWKVLDLKDIGLPNPLPNGFKLLITSRDANVCNQMGVEKSSIFRLGVIDDAEAKTLFFETVGLLKDDDPDLYNIGEEIIIRCGNFPISLQTVAFVLKSNIKDKFKWEEALSRLQNRELEDINDVLKICFEMSYNNIKTDDEKAILFLSSFFPKDFDIPVEELMRYAWGLKLFPKVYSTTLAQARQWIKATVDVLTHAKFLTESDIGVGCVKMQQHAHDFVISNFTEVKQASFDHGNMLDESYERIYLNCTGTSEFHVDFNYPNLKLLKLMGEKNLVKFPQDFYYRMENLEVVAYDRMVDPLLPSYSTNLRTLCLDSCSLNEDFSFLGSLINLEILSFAHCGIQKLPSTMGKLKRLKVLYVTGCVNLCIEDGVFLSLVNLQELYMRGDDSKAICFTDANYKELEILSRQLWALEVEFDENKFHPKDGSFEKLVKFKISMGYILGQLGSIHNLENTLRLVTNRTELVECKINELFEKTEKLYLHVKDMKNLEDVSMHYSFCNVRVLKVFGCADLTFLFTVQVASGLSKLEWLDVTSCPLLESLIHGESGDGGSLIMFPKLMSICLMKLPSLMSLCDTDNRVELPELMRLILDGLPNFTSIYHDNAMQPYALINKQVQIPNLERLIISSMEKLMQIWPCENTAISSEAEEVNNNISMLREITVVRCESLVNLFPCNPLPLLNHLERLDVIDCCSIEVLFNIDLRGAAGNINELTSRLQLVIVERLEKLREIWRIEGGNNSSGLPIRCFQAVEKIYITNCKRYRDIFSPKSIYFDMKAEVIRSDD